REILDLDLLRIGVDGDLGRQRLHRLFALGREGLVALGGDALQAAQVGARARRDEPADDDVLLQALEGVDLALDRGLGQHARRLLERGRGDEAARLQRGLGDAEQNRLSDRLTTATGLRLGVLILDLD